MISVELSPYLVTDCPLAQRKGGSVLVADSHLIPVILNAVLVVQAFMSAACVARRRMVRSVMPFQHLETSTPHKPCLCLITRCLC